jgi:MarC family membrane protein
MTSEMLSTVILLALVIDPFGNVPVVNAMVAGFPAARRRTIVLRECAIAFVILLAFMLGGKQVLDVMHLSESSLSIAGGVILLMISIRMVFAHPEGVFGMPSTAGGEPLIVPVAVPLIAGPSALATVMLMASREPEHLAMFAAAITVTMAFTTLVLLAGDRLQRRLGEHAMQAIERLMGLVLTAMAVEMLLSGIRTFVEGLK